MGEATTAELIATIQYQGLLQAGQVLADALEECTGNCTIVANTTVLNAGVTSGTQQDAPASVIALERLDIPPGEPYQFRTTYSTAGVLDPVFPSPVTLFTLAEPNSMFCEKTERQDNPGIALFTCIPLKALPALTLTAFAPNRQDALQRVSASLTVLNTSESCSCTWGVHHATHARAVCFKHCDTVCLVR